jgi:Xaa-Pro aminopeptidase
MADVLIVGDTERMMELRHEVPVQITDSFFYAEVGGDRLIGIWSFEIDRIRETGVEAEFRELERYKPEELARQGLDAYAFFDELALRVVRDFGVTRAVVPRRFPLGVADRLRAEGIELVTDQRLFDDRRRVKNVQELTGVRKAQRAAEAGMTAARELLARAERSNGGLSVEGETLTCELLKEHVERAFARNGCTVDDFIVSHGAQTAVGHDMGSGAIEPDDVVMLDLFPRDRDTGCFADMTRTFVVGRPPEEIPRLHADCKEALERAVEAIRPGVDGADVHRLVCDFFASRGYPTQLTKADGEVLRDGFYHATGHGVGLSVHEQPPIGRLGEPFVVGDVLAIEPGLYRHGVGGVRLEDLVLVTEDGCEVLTDFPYGLEVDA